MARACALGLAVGQGDPGHGLASLFYQDGPLVLPLGRLLQEMDTLKGGQPAYLSGPRLRIDGEHGGVRGSDAGAAAENVLYGRGSREMESQIQILKRAILFRELFEADGGKTRLTQQALRHQICKLNEEL